MCQTSTSEGAARTHVFRLLSSGLVLAAGCSSGSNTLRPDLESLGTELVLLGVFDAAGGLERSTLIELDRPERRALIFSLPEDGRIWGQGFDRASLGRLSPRLDWARLDEVRFAAATESTNTCPEGVAASDARSVQTRSPADALGFTFTSEEPTLRRLSVDAEQLRSLALEVPIDAARCSRVAPLLPRPFADQVRPVRQGSRLGPDLVDRDDEVRLLAVHRVDESRLLAVYRYHLALLLAREPFENESGRVVSSGFGRPFVGIAVSAEPSSTGDHRVVLTTRSSTSSTGSKEILELTLSGTTLGLPRLLWRSPNRIGAVYLTKEDDRVIAYESPSNILREGDTAGVLELVTRLPEQDDAPVYGARFERVEGIGGFELALLGSHRGGFFLGDLDTGEWRLFSEGLEPGFGVSAFAVVPRPNLGPIMWVGDDGGFLSQGELSRTRWDRITARLDPRLMAADCANPAEDACGFAIPRHHWVHLASGLDSTGGPVVVGLPDMCSVAYLIRSDGCVSHFELTNDAELSRSVEDEIVGASMIPGLMTLFSERGSIVELELP